MISEGSCDRRLE